jgi:hypothetical protein
MRLELMRNEGTPDTGKLPLRANINETFLAAQIREQGEKEMNDDRWSEGGGVGPAGS